MSHRLRIPNPSTLTDHAGCPHCARSKAREFDAEAAHRQLVRKYSQLTDVLTRYVSEAPLERGLRNRRAVEMAVVLARITGGVEVNDEHPDCCLIGQSFANHTLGWFCSGALIHPRIVVTAGHCHQPPETTINTVALGADDQNKLGGAEIVSVKRAVVHPLYTQTRQFGDMTVLILRTDAKTTPVAVASSEEVGAATKTLLVGFGNDDLASTKGFGRKRKVEVDITAVRRKPTDDFDTLETQLGFESDLEFVAGGEGFDSCNGDSGGPAYIMVDGVKKLAGLTSRATETATHPCGDGGIYTRVDRQLEFITETAKKAGINLA